MISRRRVGGEAAGHGEHLLLAARQGAGHLADALAEAGEAGDGRLDDLARRHAAVGGHAQVLADGEVAEHAAALGDGAQPEPGERVGRGAVDVAAGDVDAARSRPGAGRWPRAAWWSCRRRWGRAGRRPRRGARRGRCRAAPRCGRRRRGRRAARAAERRVRRRSTVIRALPGPGRGRRRSRPGRSGSRSGVPVASTSPRLSTVIWRAEPHHERHVVLDEQDAEAVGGEVDEELGEALGLAPRRGPTPARRAAAPGAGRPGPGPARPGGLSRWTASRPAGRRRRSRPTRSSSSSATALRVVAGARLSSAAVQHVVAHGQRAEQLEALERAGDAAAGPACGPRRLVMSAPSSATRPAVGAWRPVMTLNVVVLPAPLGPMSPVICARVDRRGRRR